MKEINDMHSSELISTKKEISDRIFELKQQRVSSVNLIFSLSMPNVGSWNGKWSGANNSYTVKRKVKREIAEKLMSIESFYHNFGDGWGVNIKVTIAKNREKVTNKFCGYEWMIDSIIKNGKIITD